MAFAADINWDGRLGNNIIQIIHVLCAAKEYGATVRIPHHSSSLLENIADKDFTLGSNKLQRGLDSSYQSFNSAYTYSILRDIIVPKLSFTKRGIAEADTNRMVIHIRNGDIWLFGDLMLKKQHIVQPPLEYYTYLLDQHPEIKDVVVIFDRKGRRSPVQKALLEYIKQQGKNLITFTDTTIEDDFTILAHAHILVHSFSTFVGTAGMINAVKNTNPDHKQYVPCFPELGYGHTYFTFLDKRIVPVSIGGPFIAELGKKGVGRHFSKEIFWVYEQNNTGKLPAEIRLLS